MAKTSPVQFFKQVRSEAKKVTWPTRKELSVSTMMVFVMVFLVAVFLYFADQVIAFLVQMILDLGL